MTIENTRNSNYRIVQLNQIRKFIDKHTAITIYKQYILPKLEYASILMDGVAPTHTNRLQKLQNKGLRICMNISVARDSNTADLHREFKIDTLHRVLLLKMHSRAQSSENVIKKDVIRTR